VIGRVYQYEALRPQRVAESGLAGIPSGRGTQIPEHGPAVRNFDVVPDGKRAVVSPRPEAGGQNDWDRPEMNVYDELPAR
jgi:hypothetical protein